MATSTLVNYGTHINTTRYSNSLQATYVNFTFTYEKKESGTSLIIKSTVPVRGGSNGIYAFVDINGAKQYTGIAKTYYAGEYGVHILQRWDGIPAGNISISFGWSSGNSSSDQHWSVTHPNNSDDGRNRTNGSNWIVYEIDGIQTI